LKAISPATIDVLFKMIQTAAPCRRFHSQHDIMALKDLVLQCFVAIVHIISGALPEEVSSINQLVVKYIGGAQ
jgi:hypothetical protein